MSKFTGFFEAELQNLSFTEMHGDCVKSIGPQVLAGNLHISEIQLKKPEIELMSPKSESSKKPGCSSAEFLFLARAAIFYVLPGLIRFFTFYK